MKHLNSTPHHTPLALILAPIITSLFLGFASSSTLATDDDYLKALESEASNIAIKESPTGNKYLDALSAEAESSAHVADNIKKASPAKEQLVLEKFLQDEKPTTYKYYKKLNARDKTKIVEYYHSDHADKATRVGHLRKKILDLYFQR
jgi:hypothetical protein